jgi:hypothetical protein
VTKHDYVERIERIVHYTLRGGNDPEDVGNVKAAVYDLCDLFIQYINEGVTG